MCALESSVGDLCRRFCRGLKQTLKMRRGGGGAGTLLSCRNKKSGKASVEVSVVCNDAFLRRGRKI